MSVSAPPTALPPVQHGVRARTWAGTHECRACEYYEPRSTEEVRAIILSARARGESLRVIGAGHSPNDCAMSNSVLLRLNRMDRLLVVDCERRLVKVQAGITLAALNARLALYGLALPALGSISEQSIAGAIATGTHGTGIAQGCLATNIVEFQIVNGCGDVLVASKKRNPDLFHAGLCSLGALGVVTGVIIQAVPAFDLCARQNPDTLAATLRQLHRRIASAPYYRFWWFPHTDYVVEWRATPAPPGSAAAASPRGACGLRRAVRGAWRRAHEWWWGTFIGFHVYQLALLAAVFLPLLIPWINRAARALLFNAHTSRTDVSHKIFNFDCLFQQHVDEWAISVDALPAAMTGLRSMLESSGVKAHFPVEVRFVAGDDIWLSPAHARATAFIGVIMYKPYGVEPEYKDFFRRFEELMASLGGRPHWAKEFHFRGDADFGRVYARWGDFKRVREEMDPAHVFVNDFLRRTLDLPPKPELPVHAGGAPAAAQPQAPPPREAAAAGAGAEKEE